MGDAPAPTREEWFPPWIAPAVIATTFVALARWSWRKWPDVFIDFPSQLYIPWQLAEGRTLYRDIDYKDGPLSQYLNALWFTCFGVSLDTIVWCNLALLAVLCTVIYWIFARTCGRFTATLAVLVELVVFSFSQYTGIGNYNYVTPYAQEQTHGLLLAVAMIATLGAHARRPSLWWIATAGGALGLTFLTKAELFVPAVSAAIVGLALITLALPTDAPRAGTILLTFLTAAAAPVLAAIALLATRMSVGAAIDGVAGNWLHLRGDILDYRFYRVGMGMDDPSGNFVRALWVLATIILTVALAFVASWLTRTVRWGRPWWSTAAGAALCASLVAATGTIPWNLLGRALPFTCAFTLLALAAYVATRRRDRATIAWAVMPIAWTTFALVILTKVVLNVRISHYGFVLSLPGTLLLVATLVWAIPVVIDARRGNGALARALLAAPVVAACLFFWQWSNRLYEAKDTPVGQSADAILTSNRTINPLGYALERTAEYLRQVMPPGATLMVVPDGLILNYWLRRPNPTRHIYFVPWSIAFAGGEAVVLQQIQEHAPDFIVLVDRSADEYGYAFFGSDEAYGGPIMRWIRGNYRRVDQLGADPLTGRGFGIAVLSRNP